MTSAWRTLATLVFVASLALLAASFVPLPGPRPVDRPALVPLDASVAPVPQPTATPAGTPAPGASPDAAAAGPVGEVVRLGLPAAGYASDVLPMTIGGTGVIDPPDFQHLFRVVDRGVAPRAGATDTAYFACHTDAKKPRETVPCNGLTSQTVRVGDPLVVELADGVLPYVVTQARQVPRDQFEHDAEVWDVNPGRIVLVTCYLSEGRRTDRNFVVIAEPRA